MSKSQNVEKKFAYIFVPFSRIKQAPHKKFRMANRQHLKKSTDSFKLAGFTIPESFQNCQNQRQAVLIFLAYSPLPLSVTILFCLEISKDRKYFCCVILLTICLFPSPNTILDLLSMPPPLVGQSPHKSYP